MKPLLAKPGCAATPSRPRSPAESTVSVSIVPIALPLACSARSVPPCWVTSRRPSGNCANAVADDRPVTKSALRVKAPGIAREPPKRTVRPTHADWLPAASLARTRSTCWPDA
jgi:hypothetical protein